MANDTNGLIQIIGGGVNGPTTLKVLSGGTLEMDTGSTITHAGVDLIDEIAAANGMDQTEFGYVNGSSTTVTASKCVVADGSKDVATIRNLTLSGNFVIGSTTLAEAELGVLDAVTPGTAAASKALVLDGSKNISTVNSLTATTVNATNIDAGASGVAGSIDIYPATASKGKIYINCVDNVTDHKMLITNGQCSGTDVMVTIPALSGYFGLSTAALSLAEMDVLDGVTAGTIGATKAVTTDSLKTTRYGGFNSGGATTDAIDIAVATNKWADGQLDIFSVFGASKTDMTGAYSAKCARFRHIVNCTTASHETYGAVGQLVAKDTTLTHLHAGVMGTFEGNTSGVVLNSGYSIGHAAVIARIGGHSTITATTPLAGFLAWNNASATLVGAASISAAFAASSLSASYPWVIGLYLPRGSVNQGIRIGNWAGSGALGNAILFSTATDSTDASQLDIVAAYGESAADLTSGISAKIIRGRHLVNGITCAHETYGVVGQVVAKNVTFSHLHAGLMGTFECNTALTVPAGDGIGAAGVIARVGGATITVGATGVLAGVLSTSNATVVSVTSGGVYAAFACRKVGSGIRFEQALHIEDALVALSFKAAASGYDHGVAAKTATLASNTSHAIKVMVGTTPGYIPVYAADTW